MTEEFAIAYDKLFRQLNDFTPEDEPWFFPALYRLLTTHGASTAIKFAKQQPWPEYTFELMVKAGLRDMDKEILLPYTNTDKEDNLYCAAFCLAACGYEEGFTLMKQFANQTHPLSKHTHPFVDILPDLAFLEDERASELKELCLIHK